MRQSCFYKLFEFKKAVRKKIKIKIKIKKHLVTVNESQMEIPAERGQEFVRRDRAEK